MAHEAAIVWEALTSRTVKTVVALSAAALLAIILASVLWSMLGPLLAAPDLAPTRWMHIGHVG